MKDTILCADKEDAKKTIDSIGSDKVENWEFLENGKVKLILNCELKPKWKHICAEGACYYVCGKCLKKNIIASDTCPRCGSEMAGVE